MSSPDIKKGATVYLIRSEYNSIGDRNQILEGKVVSVGRRYCTVEIDDGYIIQCKFYMQGFRQVSNYAPDYILYFKKQDILDEREQSRLYNEIRQCFDVFNEKSLSIDQLRRIGVIINESVNDRL